MFRMEFSLNIFTLNCWGIPGVSKNRKERMKAIAEYLSESSHNIVCLQEVWSEADYMFLRDRLKGTLSYSHYFYSGVLGSGLCVFSKWVIQDVFFHQWALNGYIHKIHHGDWFGGKGVGLCRIKCKEKLINVYCTHLHAEYHEDDIYLAHRVLQAYSTAEFINITSSPADLAVLAGDLNAAPGDLSFRLINELPRLEDPFDLECESDDLSIRKATGTSDHVNNSYSDRRAALNSPEGKRIDHILFHSATAWEVKVENFGNPLADRVPGQPFSYSDHNAVSLKLRMRPAHGKAPLKNAHDKLSSTRQVLEDAIKVCEEAKETIARSKKYYIVSGAVIFMFLIGTVGFWPNNLIYDLTKLIATGICFYYVLMGSLWNRIEMNSLKAGLSGLENSRRSYDQSQQY